MHILPQQMFGKSTFGLSMSLLKWFPIRLVDKFLLLMSHLMLGDTSQFGINRPKVGPLELKNSYGKTPVLDVGTLAQIKSGKIKVRFSPFPIKSKRVFIFFCFLVIINQVCLFSFKVYIDLKEKENYYFRLIHCL